MLKDLYFKNLLIVLLSLWSTSVAWAQGGTQVAFGQNRVQYKDFDWSSYESEHFITYYYPGGQNLAKFIINAAEDRVRILEEDLNYILSDKVSILVYNNIGDLSQTNIGISENTYNIGGKNDAEGTKIFLYFNGQHSDMLKMFNIELSKVYLNSMMAGQSFTDIIRDAVFLNLPDWFMPGVAEYIGEDWNVGNDDQLRRYWNNTKKPSFSKLSTTNPTFAGHALWYYIAKKYGRSSIKNILYLTRINRNVKKGFQLGLGVSFEDVIKEWTEYAQFHAKVDIAEKYLPADETCLKIRFKKKHQLSEIKLSPDGKNIAYAVHKYGRYISYVQNIESGKRTKIQKAGYYSDNYPYDFSYPILTWNPSGTVVTEIHEKQDKVKQVDYDLLTKKKQKNDIRDFQRVFQANYTQDGRYLILSAQKSGQTDLFLYHLINRSTSQLTNDVFDDSQPFMTELYGEKGILFTSNRPNEWTSNISFDTILPVDKNQIYFLNLERADKKISKIYTPVSETVKLGIPLKENKLTLLSDKNGIVNLYEAGINRKIEKIDTLRENPMSFDTSYTYNISNKIPVSDLNTNMQEVSIAERSRQKAYLVQGKKKMEVHLSPLRENSIADQLSLTNYAGSKSFANKDEKIQLSTKRITKIQSKTSTELDTLLNEEFQFTFHTDWNYSLLTTREKKELDKNFLDSVRAVSDEEYNKIIEERNRPLVQFQAGRAVPYRATFSSDFVMTQLDNSVLPFTYQSISQTGGNFDYPDISGMITYGIQDLMEDHKLMGGFRLPANFKGSEVFVSYENLKKRLDKRYFYYFRSKKEDYSLLVNNSYLIPAIGRQRTNYMELRLSYPFDISKSLRLYMGFRNDKLNLAYLEPVSLQADIDRKENWSFLKLEFVQDNTKEVQLNIPNGFKYKIYTEYFKNWNAKKTNLFTFGYDIRHYTPIVKNVIWANRLAGASSFGQKKVLYSLGGVDSWLNNKYDNNNFVDINEFAFQAQATNMRGFPINIRNGNSYTVLNSELRIPIMSLFTKKALKSDFLQNLQVIGFYDIGAAYKGLMPLQKDNPYITQQVTPDGASNPVVVTVKYFRRPTVMGTGTGLRTTLLGYFIRVDAAWGIDGGLVNKKPMWLFSLSKDF
ncbi:MAG: hypothetical protein M9887_01485 [Chitinophagales bacterium]|nr:hypothetical protein [Chitinophagales bacterium]